MSGKKIICPHCGEEVDERDGKCAFCGADLTEVVEEDDWMDMLSDLEDLEEGLEATEPDMAGRKAPVEAEGDIDTRLDDLLDSILVDSDGTRQAEKEEVLQPDKEDDIDELIDAVVVDVDSIQEEIKEESESFATAAPEKTVVEEGREAPEVWEPKTVEETEKIPEPEPEEIVEEAEVQEVEEIEFEEEIEEPESLEVTEEYEEEAEYEVEVEEEPEETMISGKARREKKSREKGKTSRKTPGREGPSPMTGVVVLAIGIISFTGALIGFYGNSLNNMTASLIMTFGSFISAAGINMKYR